MPNVIAFSLSQARQAKESDCVSDTIDVKGEIFLGRMQELVEKPAKAALTEMASDIGRPLGMRAVEYTPAASGTGGPSMQKMVRALEHRQQPVSIKDRGLMMSYGIFGASGSGKTHLLTLMLRQLLSWNNENSDLKYGALILDPKAALIDDVTKIADAAGRLEDLTVINTNHLNEGIKTGRAKSINIIDVALDPYELGHQLVLAAKAAGVGTSDPYWFLAWENLFGAATYLLSLAECKVTIKDILQSVLTIDHVTDTDGNRIARRLIQHIAERVTEEARLGKYPEDVQADARLAAQQLDNYFSQEIKEIATVENIIRSAYNDFLRARYQCFSRKELRQESDRKPGFYDQIIEDGKIVLFSVSPAEPKVAKIVCTLVKNLFQRTVLSRYERCHSQPPSLNNFTRPVLIACDEYSQVASEVPGEAAGDGDFFSQARQHKCMGILATQSVNVLQSSSLKENWKSVFSNFAAKIFMRLVDNETTEEATKLAGESDWHLTTRSLSRSKDGISSSTQEDLRERKELPSSVLTEVFKMGDAVIMGSLDGATTLKQSSVPPSLLFARVAKDYGEIVEIGEEVRLETKYREERQRLQTEQDDKAAKLEQDLRSPKSAKDKDRLEQQLEALDAEYAALVEAMEKRQENELEALHSG